MNEQIIAEAKAELIEWLAHPAELGKAPVKIEYVNAFEDADGITCLIFKYKKSLLGKWLLGIAGEAGVFSEMQEYKQETERADAEALLNYLKDYWKKQAEYAGEDEERNKNRGAFLAFVLLGEKSWDKEQFKKDFEADWGIQIQEDKEESDNEKYKDVMLFHVGTQLVTIGFMDFPVPNQEAEQNASMNYMWREAREVTAKHEAQILVSVMGEHADIFEDSRLYVKAVNSMCRQKNVLGVNANGIVYQPEFYTEMAGLLKNHPKEVPLFNLIWFGLAQTEKGVSGYTVGMYQFGKDEIEVLDVQNQPSEIRDFVINMASYVVENDVTLRDGETIGFSAKQKLPITRSEGVFTEGMTLKIGYGKQAKSGLHASTCRLHAMHIS